jgi:hypothetical protein
MGFTASGWAKLEGGSAELEKKRTGLQTEDAEDDQIKEKDSSMVIPKALCLYYPGRFSIRNRWFDSQGHLWCLSTFGIIRP